LARLSGVDSLHTGTAVGKMEGEKEEIVSINQFLTSDWYGLNKVLPVASGGLHPALLPSLIKILGDDILVNFGGGVHGHPQGANAGAQAVIQAQEAIKKGIKLEKYAQTHENLKIALEKWG
jgi:Ribulose 1,5-bisphosphate carboxylase, large subunit